MRTESISDEMAKTLADGFGVLGEVLKALGTPEVAGDPQTGVREYSCGPTTDRHAVEIANDDRSIVKYIMFKGGFLSVTVERNAGVPTATFRHHGVTGEVYHEDRRTAD